MIKRSITSISCILSIATSFVQAEEVSDTVDLWSLNIEQLLEIQITSASHFSESRLTAPSSVSVIDRKDWEKRAARRTSDAFNHLPGVIVLPMPTGGNAIQVRGYGSGSARGRATLLDDVPINSFVYGTDVFSVNNIELAALERIELVRGPSSTLYGSDAFHSAVSYQSWQPTSGTTKANVAGGTNDYYHGNLQASQALSDDWLLGLSLSASQEGNQNRDFDFQSPQGTTDTSQRELSWDSQTAIMHLIQDTAENKGLSAAIYYSSNDSDDFQGAGNASFPTFDKDRGGHDGNLWMLRGGYKQPLANDIDFEAKLYYWEMEHSQEFLIPFMSDTLLEKSEFDESRGGISLILRQELESMATRWSMETNYEQAGVKSNDQQRSSLNTSTIIPTQTVDYSNTNQSLFGLSINADSQLANQWNMIWGGRYDHYDTFGNEFSPRLGGIYQPTDTTAVKLVYGEAFRAPSAVELMGTSFAQGSENLNPEEMKNIELSWVHSEKQWELEWTLFHSRWQERITLVPFNQGGFTSRYVNSGESQSSGSEISLRSQLNQWIIETSASYIFSENNETNQWISVFPKLIVNVGVGYRWPEPQLEIFFANRFHNNVYTGDQALPPFDLQDTPNYFRSDITMEKSFRENWQIGLALRNIFNRDNALPSIANSYEGIQDIKFDVAMTIKVQR